MMTITMMSPTIPRPNIRYLLAAEGGIWTGIHARNDRAMNPAVEVRPVLDGDPWLARRLRERTATCRPWGGGVPDAVPAA